jgi:hypothetical protein
MRMEVRLVWALFAAIGLAIFSTYLRLPPEELYNVSEEGLALAAGRLLVFVNYPVSLAAIAIAWLAAERIATQRAVLAAALATVLCAVTAWPGVVDPHDLDAKAVNLVPAAGVAVALGMSLLAPWERVSRLPLDPIRIVVGLVIWVAALVWVAAVLGFYFPGDLLLGEELRPGGDGGISAAVHLGDHEGLDGALLVTSALLLSRLRPRLSVLVLLALAFVYGLAVEWRDFWFEQVVKREWTSWTPPQVLTPSLSVSWAMLVLLAILIALGVRRVEGPRPPGSSPGRTSPSPPPGRRSAGSTTDAPSP